MEDDRNNYALFDDDLGLQADLEDFGIGKEPHAKLPVRARPITMIDGLAIIDQIVWRVRLRERGIEAARLSPPPAAPFFRATRTRIPDTYSQAQLIAHGIEDKEFDGCHIAEAAAWTCAANADFARMANGGTELVLKRSKTVLDEVASRHAFVVDRLRGLAGRFGYRPENLTDWLAGR